MEERSSYMIGYIFWMLFHAFLYFGLNVSFEALLFDFLGMIIFLLIMIMTEEEAKE